MSLTQPAFHSMLITSLLTAPIGAPELVYIIILLGIVFLQKTGCRLEYCQIIAALAMQEARMTQLPEEVASRQDIFKTRLCEYVDKDGHKIVCSDGIGKGVALEATEND